MRERKKLEKEVADYSKNDVIARVTVEVLLDIRDIINDALTVIKLKYEEK